MQVQEVGQVVREVVDILPGEHKGLHEGIASLDLDLDLEVPPQLERKSVPVQVVEQVDKLARLLTISTAKNEDWPNEPVV